MSVEHYSRGFTLLELLVVIVIIGMISGMVTLTAGNSPALQARQLAHDVMQLLQAGRESAVLEVREYGLWLSPASYALMRREGLNWTPSGPMHALPEGWSMSLEQEGQTLTLNERLSRPQILVLSSDELSPFILHFSSPTQRWISIICDGLNEPHIDEN